MHIAGVFYIAAKHIGAIALNVFRNERPEPEMMTSAHLPASNWNMGMLFCVAACIFALTAAIGLAYLVNPNPTSKLHLAKSEVSHCSVAGAIAVMSSRGEWNCLAAQ
ncbi:hypothetical protein [Pseudovibrio sp. SCP19]|uniref:hypothetical protein n=1 Tax=Pseudovibrio sp. SCP19 TaxID=3141374 RepID=UPI003339E3C1